MLAVSVQNSLWPRSLCLFVYHRTCLHEADPPCLPGWSMWMTSYLPPSSLPACLLLHFPSCGSTGSARGATGPEDGACACATCRRQVSAWASSPGMGGEWRGNTWGEGGEGAGLAPAGRMVSTWWCMHGRKEFRSHDLVCSCGLCPGDRPRGRRVFLLLIFPSERVRPEKATPSLPGGRRRTMTTVCSSIVLSFFPNGTTDDDDQPVQCPPTVDSGFPSPLLLSSFSFLLDGTGPHPPSLPRHPSALVHGGQVLDLFFFLYYAMLGRWPRRKRRKLPVG